MSSQKRGRDLKQWRSTQAEPGPNKVRIIGGSFRGHQLEYSGDTRTRPMKDSLREALFNLVGGWIPGKLAIDLFAGTGAIGLEALSRGASEVILIERHLPTARIIQRNVQSLGEKLPVLVETGDTYFWIRQFLRSSASQTHRPWAIFCSPPYSHFEERRTDLLDGLEQLLRAAPLESLAAIEFDSRFSASELPFPEQWRVREYSPATLAIWRPENRVEVTS